MTEREAEKLIAVMLGAYPASKTTAETAGVYVRMLADLEYPAANAAVERLLATSRFMPTVAEIRDACLTLNAGEQRPGGDAWGSVLAAMKASGFYRIPGKDFVFADPVVARCVDSLGWSELCSSENSIADRARFIELYDRLAGEARRSKLSEGLPAMQRYRALEARRTGELPEPISKLLSLVVEPEADA